MTRRRREKWDGRNKGSSWIRLFAGDYLSDGFVTSLSPLEEYCYDRLLKFNARDASIPSDPERLARMCKMTPEEFEPIWEVIRCKFDPVRSNGSSQKTLTNARTKFELDRQKRLAKIASERGKKGGRPPKAKTAKKKDEKPEESRSFTPALVGESDPDPDPDQSQNQDPLPSGGQLTLARESAPVPARSPPNPSRFVAYWYDATESRDFAVRFEPDSAFREFVGREALRLGWRGTEEELWDFVTGSLDIFRGTYQKRDGKGRTRGKRIGPKRLTEDLIAWVREDLARELKRNATRFKSHAERVDDSVVRLERHKREEEAEWNEAESRLSDGAKSEALSKLLRER